MGFEFFKRPIDARSKGDPDLKFDTILEGVTVSTAASTALGPRGRFALETTSTGAPTVYTLPNPAVGSRVSLMVSAMESSSDAPFHVNLTDLTGPASSADMVVLSTLGAGISLIATSTARWLTDGNQGATFSTST